MSTITDWYSSFTSGFSEKKKIQVMNAKLLMLNTAGMKSQELSVIF